MGAAHRRIDPESAKRLASGFWKRDYDHFNAIETWTCDKRKLNDQLAIKMLDSKFSRAFANNPRALLDGLWGDGTYEALQYSTANDRAHIRFNPNGTYEALQYSTAWVKDEWAEYRRAMDLAQQREMMAYNYYTGSNTTNAITTTDARTTAAIDQSMLIRQEPQSRVRKDAGLHFTSPAKPQKITPTLIEVKGKGLVEALQTAFDNCYRKELEVLRG